MSVTLDGILFSLQRAGGISVYVRELLRTLESRNESFTLTLETPLRQEVDALVDQRHVIARPARRLERIRRCRLPRGTRVFHSSYYRLPSDTRVPSVVTVHDFIHERFRRDPAGIAHILQKHVAIRAAQAIICISEATRDDLLHYVGLKPGQALHVVHNGVGDVFRPVPAMAGRPAFALYVGERGGYKNFRLALSALSMLPGLELHCVGGGPLRPDELRAAGPNVRYRVRHLGFVTDEQLNQAYNDALCLVYPSSHEGFGIPVLEAMRAGCPVVSIDCRAVREVGGDALTVAESATPEAMAEAIAHAVTPLHRDRLSRRGRELAERFDWRTTHLRTIEVYRSLR